MISLQSFNYSPQDFLNRIANPQDVEPVQAHKFPIALPFDQSIQNSINTFWNDKVCSPVKFYAAAVNSYIEAQAVKHQAQKILKHNPQAKVQERVVEIADKQIEIESEKLQPVLYALGAVGSFFLSRILFRQASQGLKLITTVLRDWYWYDPAHQYHLVTTLFNSYGLISSGIVSAAGAYVPFKEAQKLFNKANINAEVPQDDLKSDAQLHAEKTMLILYAVLTLGLLLCGQYLAYQGVTQLIDVAQQAQWMNGVGFEGTLHSAIAIYGYAVASIAAFGVGVKAGLQAIRAYNNPKDIEALQSETNALASKALKQIKAS